MKSKIHPIIFAFPENQALAAELARELDADSGVLTLHRFPDQEIRVAVEGRVADRDVILACTLDQPNEKLVALYLTACTLRGLNARRIVLVAPYLAYMRQDKSFHEGEGVSAVHIARWLSSFLDGLVTVDPHLHRIHALEEVYQIPTRSVHAATAITSWVRRHVPQPLLVGPDSESRQWVADVARDVPCPYLILEKHRQGDLEVDVQAIEQPQHLQCTPVLIDDIISSGRTLVAGIGSLLKAGYRAPVCIGVHALLTAGASSVLAQAGAAAVVTCNSIHHPSNQINLHGLLASSTRELLAHRQPAPQAASAWSLG